MRRGKEGREDEWQGVSTKRIYICIYVGGVAGGATKRIYAYIYIYIFILEYRLIYIYIYIYSYMPDEEPRGSYQKNRHIF
jgi:hypothetical protein